MKTIIVFLDGLTKYEGSNDESCFSLEDFILKNKPHRDTIVVYEKNIFLSGKSIADHLYYNDLKNNKIKELYS